jgi:hypothetical protein
MVAGRRLRTYRDPRQSVEGLGKFEVGMDSNDAALLKLVDIGVLLLDGHAASPPDRRLMQERDDPIIASRDQTLDSERQPLEILAPRAHELDEPRASTIGRLIQLGKRDPLGISRQIAGIPRGSEVAAVHSRHEGFEHTSDDLDVLVRHRLPRSPAAARACSELR